MREVVSKDLVFQERGKGVYSVYPKGNKNCTTGQTSVDRYPQAFQMSLNLLYHHRPGRLKRVGSYPSSVFAEAASLQARIHHMGACDEFEVEGVDMRPEFIAHAMGGMSFPAGMLDKKPDWLKKSFITAAEAQWVCPIVPVQSRITILPPQDLRDFQSDGPVDAMFINNLFYHLSDEDASAVLDNLLPQSNGLICIGGDFGWDEWEATKAPVFVRDKFLGLGFSFASPTGDIIEVGENDDAFIRHVNSDSFIAIHPDLIVDMG